MFRIFKPLLYGFTGFILGIGLLYGNQMRNRPDLEIWHLAELDKELHAESIEQMDKLDDYRKQEASLFRQLDSLVYTENTSSLSKTLNRYQRKSWSDPAGREINWNQTFELKTQSPAAGVLLLHGLSDSPYSLHSLALSLHARNASVVGLRLPGHGTAPSGLTDVKWQDCAAAVRLAMRHLSEQTGRDVPLYIVGYSNGAALALEYTLSEMQGEQLPQPAGLVLISPAISVSKLAALARWNLLLSILPGMEKLAWLSIEPEIDPYKYGSFAINAGYQIHLLTGRVASLMDTLQKQEKLDKMAPVLAFQSVVDATIPAEAIVKKFMNRLPPNNHKLVLFDVNRQAEDLALLKVDPKPALTALLQKPLPFSLALFTNQPQSANVEIQYKNAEELEVESTPLGAAWPRGIYSLSHVALPFSMDDPVYGVKPENKPKGFTLGSFEAKGEKDVLQVPVTALIRLRYNPFYEALEQMILERIFAQKQAVME